MKTTAFAIILLSSLALPCGAASLAEKVTAELQSKNGSQVSGQVDFFQAGDGIEIKYKIKNLRRNKDYVLRIHEGPECTATIVTSTLPVVTSNKRGSAEGTMIAKNLSVSKDTPSTTRLLDRTITVHTATDTPSGTGLACGKIKSTVR